MEPTPDGECHPGSGRPLPPALPMGAGAADHPGAAPFTATATATGHSVRGAPPPAATAPPGAWAAPGPSGPGAAFAPSGVPPGFAQQPPRPRDRSPVVWVAVAAAAVTAVATFTVCVLLVVLAPPSAEPQAAPADADPARYASRDLAARPQAVEVDVEDHPAYTLDVPARVACEVPDLEPESASSWEEFSGDLSGCFGELWRPRLEELGLATAEPEFRVSRTNPDAGSGEPGMTLAYYENEPKTVTVVLPNVTSLARDVPDSRQEGVWSALLAHEYGHHVQELTGILDASYAIEREAADEDERLAALRRTELQAECMAGVAMQGMETFGATEVDQINDVLNGGNDLDSHGSSGNRQRWFDAGASRDTVGACNTYAAPQEHVD